jgi:hypothetical protein
MKKPALKETRKMGKSSLNKTLALGIGLGVLGVGTAYTQFGRGGASDWTTAQMNAQRTAWIKTDTYISKENLEKGGFRLQWKWKVENQPRQMKSIVSAITSSSGIGRTISILSLTSNEFAAADDDTGNLYWTRHLDASIPSGGTMNCPGGLTAGASRPSPLVPPAEAAARGFGNRGPYTSAVGEPGEGVPTWIMQGGMFGPSAAGARGAAANGARAAAPGAGPGGASGAGAPGGPGGFPGGPGGADAAARGRGAVAGRGFNFVRPSENFYAVGSDGVLHILGQNSGKDLEKPVPFLSANANVSNLIAIPETVNDVTSDIVYAATRNGCGGAPNGIWAIDLAPADKPVTHFNTGASPVGPPALSTDGRLFVAVGSGAAGSGYSHAVLALEPKTLQLKDWFTDPKADFSSAPMIFKAGDQEIVAAATRDGRVFLLDSDSLGGPDHKTPLYVSSAFSSAKSDYTPAALASWQEADGTTWILLPFAGKTVGVTSGGIVALKVTNNGGKFSLAQGWVSPGMTSPLPPIVVNGVVFAASSGEFHAANAVGMSAAERAKHSVPAVLYALDAATGKQLWSSGQAIASFVAGTGLWATTGQAYVATYDNTVYAFGFAMDRDLNQ